MAYITLNKNHFFYNLDIISKLTCGKDKIALVLKDNAYGHGLEEVATMAKEYGITKVIVRSNEEAQIVKDLFAYVLVLADKPLNLSSNIHYTINDLNAIKTFVKKSIVELKINTGMNRNGVEIKDIEEALRLIQKHELKLKAVFTHHCCADEVTPMFDAQNEKFEKIKQRFQNLNFHSLNSAGLLRTTAFNDDMVRVGIAAYGCLEVNKELYDIELKPILSLYAQKISSREVTPNEKVGYNGTFNTKSKTQISNYDIGYGDGFLEGVPTFIKRHKIYK